MESEIFEKVKKRIDKLIVQSPNPEEPFHSINTLEWLLRLEPDADEALQIAALGHDIERAIAERKVAAADFDTFDEYMDAHARNSAEILSEIMKDCGASQQLADEVALLVSRHETGGWDRLDLLVNADVLSFFHVCLPLYFDRKGTEITKKRLVWGYKKLNEESRRLIADIEYPDEELKALVGETVGI